MEPPLSFPEKASLKEVNQYLTCYLCKGYLVDATTISECLHSFCRSCIIKFLEENSHCPVCELVINKAKPNLKLDKTLQDIVYKLVPDLFLKEMTRRKQFYQHYPQLALRVSPEERGEDTERTIFNAQEKISLSLEYICDDSSPGAMRFPALVKSEKSDNSEAGDDDSQMKRFLLCPGMCRIDVLKKFVRNKYSVDTSEFYIDILYKRVPLPDHYTLIDVAYIYSWQRNETMKFFFRITDINKASSRFDFFDASSAIPQVLSKSLVRSQSSGEKNSPAKRIEIVSSRKSVSKLASKSSASPNRVKTKVDVEISSECAKSDECPNKSDKISAKDIPSAVSSEGNLLKSDNDLLVPVVENNDKENSCSNIKSCDKIATSVRSDSLNEAVPVENRVFVKKERLSDQNDASDMDNHLGINLETPKDESNVPIENKTHIIKSEPKSPVKIKNGSPKCKSVSPKSKTRSPKRKIESPKLKLKIIVQEPQSVIEDPYNFETNEFFEQQNIESSNNIICKPNCYTKITLNRTNNVEIITKVHTMPYNSRNNEVPNIIAQPKQSSTSKSSLNNAKPLVKKVTKIKQSPKNSATKRKANKVKTSKVPKILLSKSLSNGKKDFKISSVRKNEQFIEESTDQIEAEDEKCKFLRCFNLQPKVNDVSKSQIPREMSKPASGQKRKNSSPIKSQKAKIAKLHSESEDENKTSNTDKKKLVKPVKIILQQRPKSLDLEKQDSGLQSLINNCKIPSSLSITIKESSEPTMKTPVAPPVKNFIEILKISDDGTKKSESQTMESPKMLDSEKQIDQDLNEIAKSLTEKIPMSTTISHIIGPKQSFSIPIKSTLPKMSIQPAPVPELSKALNDASKKAENSFQKIFEESIKNTDGSSTNNATKRTLLKNSLHILKKNKIEEKVNNTSPIKKEETPLPKVAIPRLPHQRNLKLPVNIAPRTVASLHSPSLGMNYTVSVGQTSLTKTNKVNGTVSPEKLDTSSELKILGTNETPNGSPKKLPRSSPVVKHMFGSNSQKLVNISPKPTQSPRIAETNAANAMNTNELLEKYNLQNLAQLTATLNFNPAVLALSQTNQIAAFQQAMLLKQFEMQNRQNWLVRNQGPLLQYENYLKSLSGVEEN